ncbi:hypothetical protein [Caballeronia sp. DA-9]|uniref:hypothetical protein n=1 Tax=Caballeronia sp. DA-9 TaxID=3436237 RepID=UPI003F677718
MKTAKDVEDLAARLSSAASAPLVTTPRESPDQQAGVEKNLSTGKAGKGAGKNLASKKPSTETMALTLRPTRALLGRYVSAAADRSRLEGRMVSAQEIMLEVLEKGI